MGTERFTEWRAAHESGSVSPSLAVAGHMVARATRTRPMGVTRAHAWEFYGGERASPVGLPVTASEAAGLRRQHGRVPGRSGFRWSGHGGCHEIAARERALSKQMGRV